MPHRFFSRLAYYVARNEWRPFKNWLIALVANAVGATGMAVLVVLSGYPDLNGGAVGATAVKQFAWYHALDGHHRSGYRSSDGDCYDVRDDTADQLYRPEKATPKRNQLDAVDAGDGFDGGLDRGARGTVDAHAGSRRPRPSCGGGPAG